MRLHKSDEAVMMGLRIVIRGLRRSMRDFAGATCGVVLSAGTAVLWGLLFVLRDMKFVVGVRVLGLLAWATLATTV